MREVVIAAAARTPVGNFNGSLSGVSAVDLGVAAVEEAIKRAGITPDMVDIRISSKDGFDIKMENNNFVIINTTLNDDLIKEGIAREIVSKVQNLRKQKEYYYILYLYYF